MRGGTRGAFISFEGGDGAGKSTQIERLAKRLRDKGLEVVTTREPGGSPGAEQIRALLVDGPPERWTPLTEALLMYAARADHLERTVNPARARGAIVLSDRFADSTMAYQGLAGDLGPERVRLLHDLVVGSDGPNLTLILDAGEAGFQRATRRSGEDRFEQKGAAYQRRVRDAFRSIAAAEPRRCALVSGDKDADTVSTEIAAIVRDRLGLG